MNVWVQTCCYPAKGTQFLCKGIPLTKRGTNIIYKQAVMLPATNPQSERLLSSIGYEGNEKFSHAAEIAPLPIKYATRLENLR